MKKLISPKMQLLVLIIFISILTIYKITNHNNITYLALGDGFSRGINSYGIEEYGYSDYLRDKLQKNDKLKLYTKDFSENNKSIKMLYNDINNNKKITNNNQNFYLKEALQEADIITLHIGLNDLKYEVMVEENMNYEKLEQIIEKIKKEYDSLIKEIKRYYNKDLYVIGYPINYLESYYTSIGIRKLNDYLRNKKEIIYISIDTLENNKEKYFSNPNSNYPNRDGYLELANNIYKIYTK